MHSHGSTDTGKIHRPKKEFTVNTLREQLLNSPNVGYAIENELASGSLKGGGRLNFTHNSITDDESYSVTILCRYGTANFHVGLSNNHLDYHEMYMREGCGKGSTTEASETISFPRTMFPDASALVVKANDEVEIIAIVFKTRTTEYQRESIKKHDIPELSSKS
ncbi:hypothetical protein [Alloscardovia macacae]|nr:hypothetical protein [Alloscardovia macacae]